MQNVYFLFENIGMTNTQRNTLVQALQQLGRNTDILPHNRNHWRIRLDNQAAIFQAAFEDDDEITITAFKRYIGNVFGIAPATITHTPFQESYSNNGRNSTRVMFARDGTDRLQVILFGGPNATRETSHLECLGYLSTRLAAWQ